MFSYKSLNETALLCLLITTNIGCQYNASDILYSHLGAATERIIRLVYKGINVISVPVASLLS